MLQLRFVSIDKPPVWLVKPKYTIGSAANCEIVINHDSIMAQHAELLVVDDQLSVLPLGEEQPVLVDGQPINGRTRLRHGSDIQLGELQLTVLDPKLQQRPSGAAAVEPAPTWFLRGKNTALANKQYPLKGVMIVGRAPECDITLGVAHLSRQHARLRVLGDGLQVEDMDSSNGTYINGQKITGAVARLGDEIRFDTLSFRLCSTSEQGDASVDKTSLRPILTEAQIQAAVKTGPGPKRSNTRPTASPPRQSSTPREARPNRPVPPRASESGDDPHSLTSLLVGMTVVFLGTVGVIIYYIT